MADSRFDVVMVGAGHNGLVCAAYLARAGRRVLVVEAAAQAGGAAATRCFAPGFSVSGCAHLLHAMPRAIIEDLNLQRHGLAFAAQGLPTTVVAPGGAHLGLDRAGTRNLPPAEAAAYAAFDARMRRLAAALTPVLSATPPSLAGMDWRDRAGLLGLGARIRLLGRARMRDLLRILPTNLADLLDEHFTSDLLKGALAFDALLGANQGPRAPGTALSLFYRMALDGASGGGGLAQPLGGMGAVADALAAAARAAGAKIRLASPVGRILVAEDRAVGVELASGERIEAATVVSNADPATTLLGLLGAAHLDGGFVRRLRHVRARGLAAKLHLALDGLPGASALPPEALHGRLIVSPSINYLERAFNPTKYRELPSAPAMEITLPTLNDRSLAPPGQHVLSAIVQYVPYDLAEGWESGRARLIDSAVGVIESVLPGLRQHVVAAELLAPPDIEREYRIAGGHWHHAELSFDQFYLLRPIPEAAQYAAPVAGLYLCGAGSHPGGGITGHPGRNAARQILRRAP